MENLANVVEWLNANQGFCMVLLTLALSICSYLSYRISLKTMREQNRPHVVVAPCFLDREIYFGVSLRNCGFSTAYDVRFEWEKAPAFPWADAGGHDKAKFLIEPIASIRAGVGFKGFLGPIGEVKKQNTELVFRGKVAYKDSTGKRYREAVVVDFRMFENRGILPDNADSDMVKALAGIKYQLEGIRRCTDHYLTKDEVSVMFGRAKRLKCSDTQKGSPEVAKIPDAPIGAATNESQS